MVTNDDPGPDIRSLIAARLAAPGMLPTILSQGISRDNLLSFVGGDTVAVGTGFVVRRGAGAPALHFVHDAFGPTAIAQRLVWRRDNVSATLRRFIAMAAERYGHGLE